MNQISKVQICQQATPKTFVLKTISIPLVQASHVTDVSILWYYRNDQKSTQLLFLTLFRLLPLILTHLSYSNTFVVFAFHYRMSLICLYLSNHCYFIFHSVPEKIVDSIPPAPYRTSCFGSTVKPLKPNNAWDRKK
jgi:hypothetical protein